MRDGATAQAVIIASDVLPGEGGAPWGYKLTLRVHFDDGTKTEIERTEQAIDLPGQLVGVGDILPVRYDANDRSKVEIDSPALKVQAEAEKAQADRRNIADAEAQLDATDASVGTAHSPEDLLGERHIKILGSIKDLKQQHEAGRLTDAEFEAKKAQIMAEITTPPPGS